MYALTTNPKRAHRLSVAIQQKVQDRNPPLRDTEGALVRICSDLGIKTVTQTTAVDLLTREKRLESVKFAPPRSYAAASVFVAAMMHGESMSFSTVSGVCGVVNEVTVKNAYKHLYNERARLVDDRISAKLIDNLPSP